MKVLLLVISLLIITGCTTFQKNEDGVRRACRSGVSEYDDGSVNFKCEHKDLTHEQGGNK